MRIETLFATLCARARNLRDDQSGNVAAIFALALVPAVGLIGAAVDYSRGNATRTSMQAAADATALNLVKSASSLTSDQLSQKATDGFNALYNGSPTQGGVQVNAQYNAQARSLTVSTTGAIKTDFMGVMGMSSLAVRARAVAVVIGEGTACVLALNKTASGAAIAQGSTTVNLAGCSLYDNSGNASALTVGGSARLSALSVGVVGGISGNTSITAPNGVNTGISPIPDPYAKLTIPFYSGCSDHNFTAKTKVTINPGVYCGGMKLNAGADVTLNPGIYYIDRGDLTVNGGATLTGTGVTIIFTSSTMSNWPSASINGGAIINLTPPTDGPTAGVSIFADRNIPVGTSFSFNGGATQYLGGVIYIPTGDVLFAGGAGSTSSCTKLIADTIQFTGSSNFAIDCRGYGTKAFGPAGVRLAS